MKQQDKPAPAVESEGTWPFLCQPGQTFGYRLWTVTHAWQRRLEGALAPLGLTHMQFVLLAKTAWLTHQGEAPTQTRIACAALCEAIPIMRATQDAYFDRLGEDGKAALAEQLDRLIGLDERG